MAVGYSKHQSTMTLTFKKSGMKTVFYFYNRLGEPWHAVKNFGFGFSFPWGFVFVFIPLYVSAGLSPFFWNGQSWVSELLGSVIRGRGSKLGASGIGFPHAVVFLAQYFLLAQLQIQSLAGHSGPLSEKV